MYTIIVDLLTSSILYNKAITRNNFVLYTYIYKSQLKFHLLYVSLGVILRTIPMLFIDMGLKGCLNVTHVYKFQRVICIAM